MMNHSGSPPLMFEAVQVMARATWPVTATAAAAGAEGGAGAPAEGDRAGDAEDQDAREQDEDRVLDGVETAVRLDVGAGGVERAGAGHDGAGEHRDTTGDPVGDEAGQQLRIVAPSVRDGPCRRRR